MSYTLFMKFPILKFRFWWKWRTRASSICIQIISTNLATKIRLFKESNYNFFGILHDLDNKLFSAIIERQSEFYYSNKNCVLLCLRTKDSLSSNQTQHGRGDGNVDGHDFSKDCFDEEKKDRPICKSYFRISSQPLFFPFNLVYDFAISVFLFFILFTRVKSVWNWKRRDRNLEK